MPQPSKTRPQRPRISNPYITNQQCQTKNANYTNRTPMSTVTTQKDLQSWLLNARHQPTTSPNYQQPERTSQRRRTTTERRTHKNNNTQNSQVTIPTPPDTPPTTQPQNNQQTIPNQTGIQTTLDPPTHNNHWGDLLYPTPAHTFRIISKNVNSLPTTDNFLHWRAAAAAAIEIDANVLCFQETNLRWDNNNHTKATQIF